MGMKEILETFSYCGMKYEVLDAGEGWQAVVTEHGGHVFGPFSDACPDGIFWMPEAVYDKEKYKELIDRRIWNIGTMPTAAAAARRTSIWTALRSSAL